MKRLKQILFASILVFGSVGSVAWQAPKISVQHSNENGVAITILKLDPISIERSANSYIILNVSEVYEDNSPKPKSVSFSFHSRSQFCRFSNKSDLLLVLDGDTIIFHRTVDKSGNGLWVFSEPDGNGCSETCSALMSEQMFLRITQSKHVETRLDSVRLPLKETHLNALREFAHRMVNPNGLYYKNVGPEPREASFASSVIRLSCSVAPRSTQPLCVLFYSCMFCPKCGNELVRVGDELTCVRCPQCALSLNEFMVALVEVSPHKRKGDTSAWPKRNA